MTKSTKIPKKYLFLIGVSRLLAIVFILSIYIINKPENSVPKKDNEMIVLPKLPLTKTYELKDTQKDNALTKTATPTPEPPREPSGTTTASNSVVPKASVDTANNAKKTITEPIVADTINNTIEKISLLGKTPTETYSIIKKDFDDNVNTFEDMYAYSLKYGSASNIVEFENKKSALDLLSTEEKNEIVQILKAMLPKLTQITSSSQVIIDSKATITAKAKSPNQTGTITMVLENNIWKVELESWSNS